MHDCFGTRIIGKYFAIGWPPRSPDITPLDFYLWGVLKEIVYLNEIRSIVDLKDAIRNAFTNLRNRYNRATWSLNKVWNNLHYRLTIVMEEAGRHIEHKLK